MNMKKIIIFFLIVSGLAAQGQLVVNLQTPPAGFTYKPQLWNMLLTNTGSTPVTLHIEVTLTVAGTAQQVMSGVTNVFILAPGTRQLDASVLSPIQYNLLSNAYAMDANPYGLLPMGHFDACFSFFKHASDNAEELSQQCEEIDIEPLGPPQLVYPYDQTGIDITNPQFSWLPPIPMNLFNNLTYDLDLVQINTGQSAADAIQQNIPLYQGTDISATTLLYPISAPELEFGNSYAWRITAKANGNPVGSSETWQFDLKHYTTGPPLGPVSLPYAKLKKAPESGYAMFSGELKFDYMNEASDTVWQTRVYDLSTQNRGSMVLTMDTIPLVPGQNLVHYPTQDVSFFEDKHIYLLEIYNSRNEIWRLRFEYRRPNEQ